MRARKKAKQEKRKNRDDEWVWNALNNSFVPARKGKPKFTTPTKIKKVKFDLAAWTEWNRRQETEGRDLLELHTVREETADIIINWTDFNIPETSDPP